MKIWGSFECLHYFHLQILVQYVTEDKCHPEALGIEVEWEC